MGKSSYRGGYEGYFFFSSRRRHTRLQGDWSSDVCSSDLVVSTLTREGLPLVRYRTHDLTRVVSRAPCDCGRTSLRIDRLRGRADDMVIYKGDRKSVV